MAEYQIFNDSRIFTIYDDPEIFDDINYPNESESENDDWEKISLEHWHELMYYVRFQITVL